MFNMELKLYVCFLSKWMLVCIARVCSFAYKHLGLPIISYIMTDNIGCVTMNAFFGVCQTMKCASWMKRKMTPLSWRKCEALYPCERIVFRTFHEFLSVSLGMLIYEVVRSKQRPVKIVADHVSLKRLTAFIAMQQIHVATLAHYPWQPTSNQFCNCNSNLRSKTSRETCQWCFLIDNIKHVRTKQK